MATLLNSHQQQQPTSHPYTCLACALAFTTAQTQRTHYSTDLHRYNSKRSVAGLNPIDLNTFNQKFNQTQNNTNQSNATSPVLPFKCNPCHKSFSTQNAFDNHLLSKKHLHQTQLNPNHTTERPVFSQQKQDQLPNLESASPSAPESTANAEYKNNEINVESKVGSKNVPENQKSLLDRLIQLRIDEAPKIDPNQCLFCPHSKNPVQFRDVDHVLQHMLTEHGFFLPDQEFLVDKIGLFKYLAEKISVWNVCIYCSTGFGGKIQDDQDNARDLALATKNGLDSVRKHMCDKNHCKLAWDTEQDRLEYSDFFDYRSSYNNNIRKLDNVKRNKNKSTFLNKRSSGIGLEEDEESAWQDEDESMEHDDESLEDEENLKASFGDSIFELVLPNGVRLGHRSLRHIYKQNLLPYSVGSQSTPAGNRNMNLITKMAILSNHSSLSKLNDQSILLNKLGASKSSTSLTKSALIPARGGGLNFNLLDSGDQHQVIRAKDSGQAEFAGRHIRTFKDTHKKLQFQNRVSCKSGNNQKHYRDPLLQ